MKEVRSIVIGVTHLLFLINFLFGEGDHGEGRVSGREAKGRRGRGDGPSTKENGVENGHSVGEEEI